MSNELDDIRTQVKKLKGDMTNLKPNTVLGLDPSDYFFSKIINRLDPIEYCENVLRAHMPESRRHLHQNQVELIRAACNPNIRRVAALMARQSGKCFSKDTPILMADGSIKKVQEIQVGDYVMSPQSTPVLVTSLGSGTEEMYEVVPRHKHHESFTVNKSHILSLVYRKHNQNEIRNMTIEDYLKLSDNQKKNHVRGYRVAVEYPFKETVIEPYFFGLWLGDGSSYDPQIANVDQEVIDYLYEYAVRLNMQVSIYDEKNPERTNTYAIINGKAASNKFKNVLRSYLQENNLIGNKHITDEFMINSREVRLQVLAGIIDSDGSKRKSPGNVNSIDMSFVNKRLANDTVRLLRSLGFRASVSIKNVKFRDKAIKNYRINAYGDFSIVPTKIKRKQWRDVTLSRNPLTFGFDLIPKGVGNYYGFTIDSEDHLFLLGDYTVVHNTESVASFCGYLIDNYPGMRIGVFTPRIQQAEITVGRLSIWMQMNEKRLNNGLVKVTKHVIELDNNSSLTAVSGSDQSNIEGLTFDIIILDEAQKISNYTWSERIVPMGGGCISGDSLISLPNGELITIQDLVTRQTQKTIVAINPDTLKLTEGEIENYIDSGIQQTLKITLDSGRTIQGTLDHPVIIRPRDTRRPVWAQLQNLEVGTQVAVPRTLPYFGNVNNQHARLLGMLIGDGSYVSGSSARYGSEDEELWNYISQNYPESKITIYRFHETKIGKIFKEGTLTKMVPILKAAGIYGQVKAAKRLPIDHNLYTKDALAELLGGLFDTDGSVSISENRKVTIAFTQISLEMIREVQLSLLKFGIHSKVRTRESTEDSFGPGGAIYYELQIKSKESVNNFAQNIKFLIKRKQRKLEEGIGLLKNHKHKIQANLLDSDLRFEKIISIEDTGEKQVYDLTIKGMHNFIANGIYVHNTNGKLIKVGTPKTHNHFYESFEGKASSEWTRIRRDWTECDQLSLLGAVYLPDHDTGEIRPYSEFVMSLMPKSLKQWYFPNNPEVWTEGEMSVEDFRTQYMLEFVTGAGIFLSDDEFNIMTSGHHTFIERGSFNERYIAGIDFAGSAADGADFTHITVLRILPNGERQKVYAIEFQGVDYNTQRLEIKALFGGPRPVFKVESILADYTGCGRAIVDIMMNEDGLRQIVPITFNASDTYLKTGMNLKNAMFDRLKAAINKGIFKYPNKEAAQQIKNTTMLYLYNKMLGEWRDLEYEVRLGVNKKINAPSGSHDDTCCADALANFGVEIGNKHQLPRPSMGSMRRW